MEVTSVNAAEIKNVNTALNLGRRAFFIAIITEFPLGAKVRTKARFLDGRSTFALI
jgi:hypothetical protein